MRIKRYRPTRRFTTRRKTNTPKKLKLRGFPDVKTRTLRRHTPRQINRLPLKPIKKKSGRTKTNRYSKPTKNKYYTLSGKLTNYAKRRISV